MLLIDQQIGKTVIYTMSALEDALVFVYTVKAIVSRVWLGERLLHDKYLSDGNVPETKISSYFDDSVLFRWTFCSD